MLSITEFETVIPQRLRYKLQTRPLVREGAQRRRAKKFSGKRKEKVKPGHGLRGGAQHQRILTDWLTDWPSVVKWLRLPLVVKSLRLVLSKGPNRVDVSLPSPESGNRFSFRNVVCPSYLEFRAIGKVQKPSNFEITFVTYPHSWFYTLIALSVQFTYSRVPCHQ
jgi:hypothetical protein